MYKVCVGGSLPTLGARGGKTVTEAVLTMDRALANAHEPTLRVYTSGDMGDVYEDSFMEVARSHGESFHPTLVLVCTRLGTDTINQVYEEALIATLQMPQSVGIAGSVATLPFAPFPEK
jgi:hypothetical protein